MQTGKVGMNGKQPTVKIRKPASEDIELAKWHEKMSTYVPENIKRKYDLTAEKLRELDHLRKYARHFSSCRKQHWSQEEVELRDIKCTCGLEE